MYKKFLFSFFILFSFSLPCFASLPLGSRPFSTEYSFPFVLDDDQGIIHNTFLDRPFPLSLEVLGKNFVDISGTSSLSDFADYDISFCSFYSRLTPYQIYSNFTLSASHRLISSLDWPDKVSSYSSYLNISAFPYPSLSSPFSRLDWSSSSFSSLFDPPVYSSVSNGFLSFDRSIDLGSSQSGTWTKFYYPIDSDSSSGSHTFSSDSSSVFYYGNWTTSIIANHTVINLTFDFGDDLSVLSNHLVSSLPVNFNDAYISALSSGLQDFSFGLSLSDSSLSNIERSLGVWVDDDSLIFDDIFHNELDLNRDRKYDNPIFPLSFSTELNYGIYYSLISSVDSSVYGPFLFNTSYDISLLPDISSDYYVSLDVYYQDISISLTNFRLITGDFWVDDDDINFLHPLSLSSIPNTGVTFGSNLTLSTWIYNLQGFSFRPTIYADGTGLNDIDDTLKGINDSLNSGFVSLGERIDRVNDSLHSIDGTIKDSTKSINNMLDYVQRQISSSISDGVDQITGGWSDDEAKNLLFLYDEVSSQLDNSVGDIFDILSSSLERSGWSFPSWDDFSSLMTSFSLVNFGLTSLYSILGGAAVIGLVLSFYFALKALWAIIHRGN